MNGDENIMTPRNRPGLRRRPVTSIERVACSPTPLVVTVIPMSSIRPSVTPLCSGQPIGFPHAQNERSSAVSFMDWSGNKIPWPSPNMTMNGQYSRSATPSMVQGPLSNNFFQRTSGHSLALLRERSSPTRGERYIQSGVHQNRIPIFRETFDTATGQISPRDHKSSSRGSLKRQEAKKHRGRGFGPPPSPTKSYKFHTFGTNGQAPHGSNHLGGGASYRVIPNIGKKVDIVVPTSETPLNEDLVKRMTSEEEEDENPWATSESDDIDDTTSHDAINNIEQDT